MPLRRLRDRRESSRDLALPSAGKPVRRRPRSASDNVSLCSLPFSPALSMALGSPLNVAPLFTARTKRIVAQRHCRNLEAGLLRTSVIECSLNLPSDFASLFPKRFFEGYACSYVLYSPFMSNKGHHHPANAHSQLPTKSLGPAQSYRAISMAQGYHLPLPTNAPPHRHVPGLCPP